MTIARSTTRFMALLAATAMIGACTTADTSFRSRVESYFRENIADLSPRRATQGEFSVSRVEWVDDDTVRVTYSDEADVELVGIGDVVDDDGTVLVRNFRIDNSGSSSSSSFSTSSMSFSSAGAVSSSSNISGMTSSVTSAMSVSSVSSSMTTSASSMTTVSSASSYSL